jgi:hypothetical protein
MVIHSPRPILTITAASSVVTMAARSAERDRLGGVVHRVAGAVHRVAGAVRRVAVAVAVAVAVLDAVAVVVMQVELISLVRFFLLLSTCFTFFEQYYRIKRGLI